MHTLKITGETPEALYMNVVNTLSMFLRGPQTTAAPQEAGAIADTQPPEGQKFTTSSTAETAPVTKTRKNAKADKTVEKLPNDPLPDVMTIDHDATELGGKPAAKELTLAGDIIPRLQAIQVACTKRGLSMPDCVSYIQKLYGPFGIANAKQLKIEQFEEFLEASDAYLKGEA